MKEAKLRKMVKRKIIRFLSSRERRGYSPSYMEKRFGVSYSTLSKALKELLSEGRVRMVKYGITHVYFVPYRKKR